MITVADIQDSSVAAQIHALQQAAYSVEARRIACQDFPPLRETCEALQRSPECFLVFCKDESVIGALSYKCAADCVTVTRLVVSPDHFRQGIATALLQALEGRLSAGTRLDAFTADLNEAAIRAYERQGYRTVSKSVTPEGIALIQLRKRIVRQDEQSRFRHNAVST